MKYIAKPNTWFKTGTECVLEEFLYESPSNGKSGIFRGIRICENPLSEGGINKETGKFFHEVGEEYEKGEVCSYNEFQIIDEEQILPATEELIKFRNLLQEAVEEQQIERDK